MVYQYNCSSAHTFVVGEDDFGAYHFVFAADRRHPTAVAVRRHGDVHVACVQGLAIHSVRRMVRRMVTSVVKVVREEDICSDGSKSRSSGGRKG